MHSPSLKTDTRVVTCISLLFRRCVHEAPFYTSKLKEFILVKKERYPDSFLYILIVSVLHKALLLASISTVPLHLGEGFTAFSLTLQPQWFRHE